MVGADELSIDFRLECGSLISIPKRYMRNSEFVNAYALRDTVVTDIIEVPEKEQMFEGLKHKEFYICLDTGAKYIVCPNYKQEKV